MSARGELRRSLEASWSAAARYAEMAPTATVIAGAMLAAAGGNAERAIAKLDSIRTYLEGVRREDQETARRAG